MIRSLVLTQPQAEEESAAQAVVAGAMDEAAFQDFYRRHARPLWAYVCRVSGSADAADDILQDAFCRFLRSPVGSSENERRAYLYRIASNLIVDRWRQRGRDERTHAAVAAHEDDAKAAPDFALRQDMARTFGELKPQERVLLWLAYVEGSDHGEIAAALCVKEASVKVMLFRARKRLAGLLRGKGIGSEVK